VYIDPEDIRKMEILYGPAARINVEPIAMFDFEFELMRSSMKRGRRHDVTMFISHGGGYVGIQKPQYSNTGIFRAPSGGVNPGETLEAGIKREMYEETGLRVEIERFLIIMSAYFTGPDGEGQEWMSYIFSGKSVAGELSPVDTREISSARIVTREEMLGPIAAEMIKTGWGGFIYRARIAAEAFAAMDGRDNARPENTTVLL